MRASKVCKVVEGFNVYTKIEGWMTCDIDDGVISNHMIVIMSVNTQNALTLIP
jgi:hypothetical protein